MKFGGTQTFRPQQFPWDIFIFLANYLFKKVGCLSCRVSEFLPSWYVRVQVDSFFLQHLEHVIHSFSFLIPFCLCWEVTLQFTFAPLNEYQRVFLLWLLLGVSSVVGFQWFFSDVPKRDLISIYHLCSLWHFLNLWLNVSHGFWRIMGHSLFKYCFSHSLSTAGKASAQTSDLFARPPGSHVLLHVFPFPLTSSRAVAWRLFHFPTPSLGCIQSAIKIVYWIFQLFDFSFLEILFDSFVQIPAVC